MRLQLIPVALACLAVRGQPQDPRFEVASIKPGAPLTRESAIPRVRGGPGTPDPGIFDCTNCDIVGLICVAYGPLSFGQFQAAGALNPLITSPFDIAAKVPSGATREEFRMMLRSLLAERFKLKVHRDLRIIPAYELTVTKDGPKFKPAEPKDDDPPAGPELLGQLKRASDGSVILPPGVTADAAMHGAGQGHGRIQVIGKPISNLTQILSNQFLMPILDKTGLTETYDISVSWQWEDPDPDRVNRQASLQDAIRSQLGLQLRPTKDPVPVLVLDHVEKPIEN